MKDNCQIRSGRILPKTIANLVTAHIGKVQIEKNRIHRFTERKFQAFLSRSGINSLKTREFKKFCKPFSMSLIVVDYQNLNRRHGEELARHIPVILLFAVP